MQATLRHHVVLATVSLLLFMSCAGSRGVDRDWRWNSDILTAFGDLAACPGCAKVDDDAERYPPNDTGDDLQKLKRTRKNYSNMEETCECTTDKWNNRSLGADHYPANVSEVNCTVSGCSNCYLPFKCTAHLYDVYVLKAKLEKDSDDDNVPVLLRDSWKFVKIPISIGCKCTRG